MKEGSVTGKCLGCGLWVQNSGNSWVRNPGSIVSFPSLVLFLKLTEPQLSYLWDGDRNTHKAVGRVTRAVHPKESEENSTWH